MDRRQSAPLQSAEDNTVLRPPSSSRRSRSRSIINLR